MSKCPGHHPEKHSHGESLTPALYAQSALPQASGPSHTSVRPVLDSLIVLDKPQDVKRLTIEERRERRRKAREAASESNSMLTWSVPRSTTISSLAECESEDSLEVRLQVKYTGPRVISSAEASMHLSSTTQLLEKLNEIEGTSYTLTQYPELTKALEAYIAAGYDFGVVYARLRPCWTPNPETGLRKLEGRAGDDAALRSAAVHPETGAINPSLPPRRLWDLFSNRVVPYYVAVNVSGAVSHSWMDDAGRHGVQTAINGSEWPVPIPTDTTLERVRIELLNLRLQYVWLDVLCLRQKGPDSSEAIRLEEWKTDVPTIGDVYHGSTTIVHYYNGLGRPFYINNLDSERHWLNRAWTLQEVTADSIIAGVTPHSILPTDSESDNPQVQCFYGKIASLASNMQHLYCIYLILDLMRSRSATQELDKIAGLAYRVSASYLPPYVENQSPEDAWDTLVKAMSPRFRGDLLFLFSRPGKGRFRWSPTWEQIKTETQLPCTESMYEPVEFDKGKELFCHQGYRFDGCELVAVETSVEGRREWTAYIRVENGEDTFALRARAYHCEPIYPGKYTFVSGQSCEVWLLGRPSVSGAVEVIEKVSVLKVASMRLVFCSIMYTLIELLEKRDRMSAFSEE